MDPELGTDRAGELGHLCHADQSVGVTQAGCPSRNEGSAASQAASQVGASRSNGDLASITGTLDGYVLSDGQPYLEYVLEFSDLRCV